MNTFKTVIVGVAAGVVFAGAATVLAPLVHADEGSFVELVAYHGTPVTEYTLPLGHAICTKVAADGTYGFDEVITAAKQSGVSDHDAAVLSVVAVHELCPSQIPTLQAYLSQS